VRRRLRLASSLLVNRHALERLKTLFPASDPQQITVNPVELLANLPKQAQMFINLSPLSVHYTDNLQSIGPT